MRSPRKGGEAEEVAEAARYQQMHLCLNNKTQRLVREGELGRKIKMK
jgi:hypothetical protein